MCKAFEEVRNEASLNKEICIARNLISMGKMSPEMIALATELLLEKVQEIAGTIAGAGGMRVSRTHRKICSVEKR